MGLKSYKQKRSFKQTPEPTGKKKPHLEGGKEEAHLFVIQKHDASHLHYDFRLEVEGVLKSWAIPKGPSMNPAEKHLAIMVEDHPLEYRDFEGTIPEGSYGAGTVMVWDQGIYYSLDDQYQLGTEKTIKEGLRKGKIHFALAGKKLKGIFSLVKIKGGDENKSHWLWIKKEDDFASTQDVLKKDKSVLTQRTMNQIAMDKSLSKK